MLAQCRLTNPVSGSESWSIITFCNRTTVVGRESKPGLINPDGIDPYRDMEQLDIITRRALAWRIAFDRAYNSLDRSADSLFLNLID